MRGLLHDHAVRRARAFPAKPRAVDSGRGMALLSLCALVMGGCDLGESDVISRSPDLGPPTSHPPSPDAPGLAPDAGVSDATDAPKTPTDSLLAGRDAVDAPQGRPEAGSLFDAPDVAPDADDAHPRRSDAEVEGEVGALCADPGFVFCEDFEEGAPGWMTAGENWSIMDDVSSTESNAVFGPNGNAASKAFFTEGRWQDMTVTVRVRVLSFGQPTSSNRAEVYARYQDSDHLFAASLRGDGKLGLRKNATGIGTAVAAAVAENEWHTLAIRVAGRDDDVSVEGYIDGRMVVTAVDIDTAQGGDSSALGTAGLGVYGGTMAVFDDLKVSSP